MANSLAHEIGYILIGYMVGLVLLGLSLVQTWICLTVYRKDPLKLKILVIFVMLVDLINTVAGCQAVYTWFIHGWAQPEQLNIMNAGFVIAIEAEAVTAYLCQLFFAWRMHHLRRQWWLTALAVFFATSAFLCGTGTIVGSVMLRTFDKMPKLKAIILVWSGCSVLCDLLTTITLTMALKKAITGFEKTDTKIVKVKNLILQSSGLVMSMDLMHLLIVAAKPSYMLHLSVNSFLAKLYANSLFSTLNVRSSPSRLLGQEASTGGGSGSNKLRWRASEGKTNWVDQRVTPLPHVQNLHSPIHSRFGKQATEGTNGEYDIQVTTVQEHYVSTKAELSEPAFASDGERTLSAAETFTSIRPPCGDQESRPEGFEMSSLGIADPPLKQTSNCSPGGSVSEPCTQSGSWREEAHKRQMSSPHD